MFFGVVTENMAFHAFSGGLIRGPYAGTDCVVSGVIGDVDLYGCGKGFGYYGRSWRGEDCREKEDGEETKKKIRRKWVRKKGEQ